MVKTHKTKQMMLQYKYVLSLDLKEATALSSHYHPSILKVRFFFNTMSPVGHHEPQKYHKYMRFDLCFTQLLY